MRNNGLCAPHLVLRALVAALLGAFAASASAEPPPELTEIRGAEVIEEAIPTVFNGDLRDLPRARQWMPGDPIKEVPRRHNWAPRTYPPEAPFQVDPLLEIQSRAPVRAPDPPILNFAGQGFTGVNPPDTVGDVGLNHYIQAINAASGGVFTVYNKSNGSVAAGPIFMESMGTGNCTSGLGDPVVLYDQLADRWFLSEFSSSGNRLCIYISQTSNPITGGWFAYQFTAPGFPDYPKYGVWPDAYYASANESSPSAFAFDRARMLAGLSATAQRFTAPDLAGFGFQALIPADADGENPPPAGAPNPFMRHRDDEVHNSGSNNPTQDFLEIWSFHVDWTTPASSTFTGPINIPMAEIDSNLCGLTSFSCFPQPSGPNLDPLREVIMNRLQYRNFGTHQTLVSNLVTDVATNRGGIRWFELRNTGSGWSLHQQGTFSPDTHNRWMGSAAMDGAGNIGIAYNVSSTTVFPSIRFASRLASSPLGTLDGEVSVIAGAGANSSNRYGDYAATSVDPVDDRTFWVTSQYSPASSWATRIATFHLGGAPEPTDFYTLAPCRLFDTRISTPALQPTATRTFTVTGVCGVPTTAKAISVNMAAILGSTTGFLTVYAGDLASTPAVSSINFPPGLIRANNAIVQLATDGSGTIIVFNGSTGTVDMVLDVNGYFE